MPIKTPETSNPDFEIVPIWAKVFTAYGKQLLVTKSYDQEEDKESLDFEVDAHDGRVACSIGFDDGNSRDIAFRKVGQYQAEELLSAIKDKQDTQDIFVTLLELLS